ncbi:M48 family metallopeptidase [bacterium]|nr:M48 family metallopeptidase [bacterium]
MKNIIAFLLFLLIATQCSYGSSYLDKQLKSSKHAKKYNSVKIHTQSITNNSTNKKTIKDPKLIKLSNVKEIDSSKYNAKLKQDEIGYEKQKKELTNKKDNLIKNKAEISDFYNLYRVVEKIIRANNLDYVNWRIVLYKETENFNAFTTAANLIGIYSALYDSLYGNDDAIAFVVSHELSHQILGHAQREVELSRKLRTWVPEGETGMLDTIYYKKLRDMEFEADSEAMTLLKRAGYSPEKALDAINFIEALPNYKKLNSSHPMPKDRRENILEISKYLNPQWVNEGKANIYSSDVLDCKVSADKVSFVIVGNNKKNAYEPETYEQRLLRYAYLSYLQKDNKQAAKYFEKLIEVEPKFEYYLYLSYAFENLYQEKNKSKLLEKAQLAAQEAVNLSNGNKYAKEQLEAINKLNL